MAEPGVHVPQQAENRQGVPWRDMHRRTEMPGRRLALGVKPTRAVEGGLHSLTPGHPHAPDLRAHLAGHPARCASAVKGVWGGGWGLAALSSSPIEPLWAPPPPCDPSRRTAARDGIDLRDTPRRR